MGCAGRRRGSGRARLGCSPGLAASEVIELKDGHQVVGEVVAEKANFLFVDLGFDIVKIPKDQVLRRAGITP